MQEYTPIRRFYAWVGFVTLVLLAVAAIFFAGRYLLFPSVSWAAEDGVAGTVQIEVPQGPTSFCKATLPVYRDGDKKSVRLGISQCTPLPWDAGKYRCNSPIIDVPIP